MELNMENQTLDRAESLHAYPTLSAAARLIGIATSTLSRREDCNPIPRGTRDRVLPPAEVMRFAAIYRKRSLNEVAADLIDEAAAHGSDEAARTEEAVEAFFAGRSRGESVDEFLAQAKRYLPQELYTQVASTVNDGAGRRPAAIVGHVPGAGSSAKRGRGGSPAKPTPKPAARTSNSDTQATSKRAAASAKSGSRKGKLAKVPA